MSNQGNIQSKLSRIKKDYFDTWPLCLCCNHRVGANAQLAHIIRKSQMSSVYPREELITMKLNTGLAHPDCHHILDNDPEQAIYLPRFNEIHFIMWLIDPEVFHQVSENVYPFYTFPDFESISNEYAIHIMQPRHHGELLFLPVDI